MIFIKYCPSLNQLHSSTLCKPRGIILSLIQHCVLYSCHICLNHIHYFDMKHASAKHIDIQNNIFINLSFFVFVKSALCLRSVYKTKKKNNLIFARNIYIYWRPSVFFSITYFKYDWHVYQNYYVPTVKTIHI